jgi:putative DNA primase/helicase
VRSATSEYRQDEDHLGAFLEECCVMKEEIEAAKLRDRYEDYCREIGEKPLASTTLGRELSKRGITKSTGTPKVYRGISLR